MNIKGLLGAAASRRASLAFGGRGAYEIESLESGQFTQKELRREYSRLRGIAMKRFKRLAESEFATGEKVPYNYRPENYPALKELDQQQLLIKLRDLAGVVESRRSTLTGLREIREESVKTLQGKGITWVTEKNWLSFGEFMRDVRAVSIGRMFDSDRAVDLYIESVYEGANAESLRSAYSEWLETQDALVNQIPEVKR